MNDANAQIDAVQRRLGSRTLAAGEARVMTISQTYDSTPEDVWDACTTQERLTRWFGPVSGELRLHGRYQMEGNISGTVERCDPPKSFAATWEFGGEVSWIEVRLDPTDDGRTRLHLEHVAHVNDEFWLQYGPGAVGVGWDVALFGLACELAGTGRDVPLEQDPEWAGSSAHREFVTASSQRWREASVAAGTDPEQARTAADRTTDFYTAPPQG
ncbi:SRPBCC family protein [Micromonospora sp. NPDC002389]|uniref:SRPBCC family protein n=1 Tax=Micromonospora sp. NPDC002389 TaxID=3154272 RepID=UPI0033312EF9